MLCCSSQGILPLPPCLSLLVVDVRDLLVLPISTEVFLDLFTHSFNPQRQLRTTSHPRRLCPALDLLPLTLNPRPRQGARPPTRPRLRSPYPRHAQCLRIVQLRERPFRTFSREVRRTAVAATSLQEPNISTVWRVSCIRSPLTRADLHHHLQIPRCYAWSLELHTNIWVHV
jgi:hypothetical protein